MFVVLDHDYRPDRVSEQLEAEFESEGIVAHVWKRKELESYLLTPAVIARVSGASVADINNMLDEITESLESYVFGRMLGERIQLEKGAKRNVAVISTEFKKEFDRLWANRNFRLYSCPTKKLIRN